MVARSAKNVMATRRKNVVAADETSGKRAEADQKSRPVNLSAPHL